MLVQYKYVLTYEYGLIGEVCTYADHTLNTSVILEHIVCVCYRTRVYTSVECHAAEYVVLSVY